MIPRIIRCRRGQTLTEALVVMMFLPAFVVVLGFSAFAPMSVFYAEDLMEESLLCGLYQMRSDCESRLNRSLRVGILKTWFTEATLRCNDSTCTAITHWDWPAPLPKRIQRQLSKSEVISKASRSFF